MDKPKLRHVNVQQVMYQGEPVFLIQDSLRLTEAVIMLPQVLGPLAMMCDGYHTIPEMRATLEVRYGLHLSEAAIQNLIDQFDEALLLEGDTFNQAKQAAIEEFRAAPFREPTLAGPSYPSAPKALRRMLQDYLNTVNGTPAAPPNTRAIISPHIDYQRGGTVYAKVWASAAAAVQAAELIVILGTDHKGGDGTLTLTRQNYASPLGIMPTDQDLVSRMAESLGPEVVFADELHHRDEHSIELVLVWLQYLRQEQPCPTLPILTGSFHSFVRGPEKIEAAARYRTFVDILRDEMRKRRTLIVASGDLAHMGPAFSGPAMRQADYDKMQLDDRVLINNLCAGNAQDFFKLMSGSQYERNVCGFSPFYFTLDALNTTEGIPIAYDRCPADMEKTSYVSICGVVLS